jgi:pimeloyl-ACP methyl ester carboxylesterase
VPAVNVIPFGLMSVVGRRAPEWLLQKLLKTMPAVDAQVLSRPELRSAFRASLADPSPTAGRAAAQEFALFTRDWGLRLEHITVPVHVWQGDADVNVPLAHAERQAAAIPGAVLRILPGEGHLMYLEHFDQILSELIAATV